MQIDQLFELAYILIDKKHVTAKEMAEHFGISTRTVYRWVEALSISGVPVYSLKGRGGGIAISENYVLDKRILSEDERLAIVSSVKALNTLSGNSISSVNSSIKAAEKITGLMASDTDWLEVDFSPWCAEGKNVQKSFGIIRDCILHKKQVVFDYYSGNGTIESRTVHPWELIYKGQAWYLQGWCTKRKAERFFKLSRIRNLTATGRNANITEQKSASKKTSPQKQHDQKPKLLTIKAKVFPPRISYLLDTFICSEVNPHKDGSITATFTVPETDWIYDLLLSFTTNMKIISPKSVRDHVLMLANSVQKLYEK